MATNLSFLSGRQITDDNGAPQAGAQLYHYQAGTTSDLTVYSNNAGTTPHAQPVVCDAGGFVPLIYVDDSSDWKVVIQDADDVTLQTYDNLPAADPDESSTGFAPPLFEWTQVTSAASPVALTASDAGNAYEADTTSGGIEFDLPSAASVGNGKGFLFKKVVAANTMTIDPSGSETIDDSSTSLSVTRQYQVIGIFSNGAEWYKAFEYLDSIGVDRLASTFINSLSATTTPALSDELLLQLAGAGAFRKVTRANLIASTLATEQATTSGTAFDFTGIDPAARKIDVLFNEVSLSGSDQLSVQIGDAGGIETTGYVSTAASANNGAATDVVSSTSSFVVYSGASTRVVSGILTLARVNSSHLWVASGAFKLSTANGTVSAGSKTLSAALDRVRVTRDGTNTFDAGSVNIIVS